MKKYLKTLIFAILLLLTGFTGQSLATAASQIQPWIRVALSTGQSSISVETTGPSEICALDSASFYESYSSSRTFSFSMSGGQVRYSGTGDTSRGFVITCDEDTSSYIRYNGRRYRGSVRIQVWEGSLVCVNALPIEQYLWGVVPCEVPHLWPEESLRAQAVAARTYSLRALEQYPERPFDVYSSVVDQVYNGADSEREATTRACKDTAGQVITYNGSPIIAYFHASSGGWTASGMEMFRRDLPYLRPVPSRDATIHRWIYRISASDLASVLRNAGYSIGTIQRVWVHSFSGEGRANQLKVVHSNGVTLVPCSDLRKILGPANLQSTYFTIEGQEAPEIPDGSECVAVVAEYQDSSTVNQYASGNLHLTVPVPYPVEIENISVMGDDGTSETSSVVVAGAGEAAEYQDGFIWIAEAVRVDEIESVSSENIFSLAGEEPGNEAPAEYITSEGTFVDDPGSSIGGPSDGYFVFVGHGCGHGVGMSQHGARILAENGWNHNDILHHFYTGVEIESFWTSER